MTVDTLLAIDAGELLRWFLVLVGVSLLLSALLLGWVLWQVRRIRLPADADFITALQRTPLSVVLLIDALDLSLDFLAAPIAWTILDRLGLKPLRGVSVIEALIPGTQLLPTMTVAWVLVRLFGRRLRL